jgi:prophage antirepressor-like protein
MKDTDLITFENSDIGEIRGFLQDGEPWFLAGQVCRELGIKDASSAVAQVTERFKIADYDGPVSNRVVLSDSLGRKNTVIIIPEPYLYELIFASRKQKAIKFRTWVTKEVLPELRKHGSYRMAGKLIRRALTDEIKESGENERMKGHAYSTYSVLINKSLGLSNRVQRDSLDSELLEKIAQRENTVQALLREGKDYAFIKQVIISFNQEVLK